MRMLFCSLGDCRGRAKLKQESEQISIDELAERSFISSRDIQVAIAKGTTRFKEWLDFAKQRTDLNP